MSQLLYKLGRLAARRPWRVIGAWALISIIVIGAASAFGKTLEDSFEVPGLDSQEAVELLSSGGSDQAGLTAQVVLTPSDPTASFFVAQEARDSLVAVRSSLTLLPNVLHATDPAADLDQSAATAISHRSVSSDGRVALIRVQYPVMEELSAQDLENLKSAVADARATAPLQIEMMGDLFSSFEEPETGSEVIGVIAAAVILLVAFGSVIAMGLPIGTALFGLALGLSSMSLVTYLVDIPSWVPLLGAMVGLGVGIDYALFLVTRHRENLSRGLGVEESVGRAVATAGQAVIFAGGTVVIAILGLAVAGVPFVTAAGIAISVIVLIMVAASITLLPAFLGLVGHWIDRIGFRRKRAYESSPGTSSVGGGWTRWGVHVSGHAWQYAVGVTLLLLAMTAPVLGLRLGFPDQGTLPETRTERRAYDLIADGFGAGTNGPLIVAIDTGGDLRVVEAIVSAVERDPGVIAASAIDVDAETGVASVVAFPTSAPQDDETLATIDRLRSDVLPSIIGDGPARAHVGGYTATVSDVADRVTARLPLFIAAVLLLSFVLLTVTFRSVLVALKAALLNLLSIGAAYGVLVMVFQWGWGAELIGLESTVPIVSFIPLFMFAILFGLSMDYEVFLLSRVREEYLRTGDNDGSVIRGIASTARVITSAALIMISVFLGFVLGEDPTTKMFGLGLATAIFVDATIVRMVLVPATMKLMGDYNWWIPQWLDRILPRVDIEGEHALPPVPAAIPSPSESDPSPEPELVRV